MPRLHLLPSDSVTWLRLEGQAELSKRGVKGRIKGDQNSTPSEPPDLKSPDIDFPPWLTYPFI
jgi:hypothetical protein